MKNKEKKDRMSKQARREIKALRREFKKSNPDLELNNYLLNGDKYSFPISKRVN